MQSLERMLVWDGEMRFLKDENRVLGGTCCCEKGNRVLGNGRWDFWGTCGCGMGHGWAQRKPSTHIKIQQPSIPKDPHNQSQSGICAHPRAGARAKGNETAEAATCSMALPPKHTQPNRAPTHHVGVRAQGDGAAEHWRVPTHRVGVGAEGDGAAEVVAGPMAQALERHGCTLLAALHLQGDALATHACMCMHRCDG
eukprot:scaffold178997_cov20-Tisochrysis_lutea.AAC.1